MRREKEKERERKGQESGIEREKGEARKGVFHGKEWGVFNKEWDVFDKEWGVFII